MLLESIKLVNFRQFRNETIDFAKGENGKNVTIIIGENGTGKTTFAQAFFWCLYGETSFSDKTILNKIVATELTPSQEAKVSVTLKLRHGEVDYTLVREQMYKKEYSGRFGAGNTVFDIGIKDVFGNTSYVKKTQCEMEVKGILPKELSKYFFFDGERIEKMSKDIAAGKKAPDFADAVKGLLGLNGMLSAISHLNPGSKYSVIGSYSSSFDSKSNANIMKYTRIIEGSNEKIEAIDLRLEELDSQIISAENRKRDKSEEIKQYAEGETLQKKKENLQKQIKNTEMSRANIYKAICKDFQANTSSFFSLAMVKFSLEKMKDEDFSRKDIPFMHVKTIEYLLEQKICICGTHLDPGTIPCDKVTDLMTFLPPNSISTAIADFKKEAKFRTGKRQDLYNQVKENLTVISRQNDELIDLFDELQRIDIRLSGGDVRDKVRTINSEIKVCDETIRTSRLEREQQIRDQERLKMERDRADSERQNLTLLDENNKKIAIYKAYAERIYEEINNVYTKSEEVVRNKLQDTINDIFKSIYEGGLYLTIDSKYHISVYATDYEGDVETSTAQSISVIFAFITGIIKMTRENRNSTDEDAKLLSSEPYPLVMDAPLSAFDKRRIKTVCNALPEAAEQVIIFIKDTDGELAEEYMGDRIGSRHSFDKKNEFETVLV